MNSLEIIQGTYAAFGEGDMEKLASLFAEDWVGTVPDHMPNGRVYHGASDFIQNFLAKLTEVWPDFGLEPIGFYESGDTVFMHGKITAGGKTTETIHMSVVKDGKAVSWQPFDDTHSLISAAS